MGYNVKSVREDFKKSGIFYTPRPLAEYMRSFLPEKITEVYDPTCGHGSLLEIFPDVVKKYGQDINPDAVAAAREKLANMLIFVPPLAHQRGAVRTLDSMLRAIKGIEEAMQRIGGIGACEREEVFKLLDRGREPARRQGGAAQMLLSL